MKTKFAFQCYVR